MAAKNYFVLASVIPALFIGPFLVTAVNLCIPSMESALFVNAATIGWTITVFNISQAAFSLPMGKIADLTSRRMMFILGLIVLIGSSFATGMASSFGLVLVFRVIQAVGCAMTTSTAIPIAITMFPPEQRGKIIGICSSAVYFGSMIGPTLGGVAISAFSWRAVFFLAAIVAAIALIIAFIAIPRGDYQRQEVEIDVPGNALYLVMISLILFGLTGINTIPYAWVSLFAGVAVGVVFVLVERRAKEPVLRLGMFTKDRVFTLSTLAAFLNYGSVSAMMYLLSIYLQSVCGFSSMVAGLILLISPIVQVVLSPIAGALSDRFAAWKISTFGMSCSCIALLAFAFLGTDTPLALICAVLAIAGIGTGTFASPNTNVMMSCVSKEEFGSANAIIGTMRTAGSATSMSVTTIVVGSMMGGMAFASASTEQLVGTISVCFGVFALMAAVGIVCSSARKSSK